MRIRENINSAYVPDWVHYLPLPEEYWVNAFRSNFYINIDVPSKVARQLLEVRYDPLAIVAVGHTYINPRISLAQNPVETVMTELAKLRLGI